jgi:hypothetical protein
MNRTASHPINFNFLSKKINYSRGKLFGLLIIGALLAFELFNYTTTDFALNDLLGGLRFVGVRWATILAIAFCGIDFAGIARLFTPQQGENSTREVWYLFGAWLLAACMNAMLTWWGVALAIVNHNSLGGSVISHATLLEVVPIFVAIMVWLIRVLIIGTFSVAGNRLFSQVESYSYARNVAVMHRADNSINPAKTSTPIHPIPKSSTNSPRQPQVRQEPTYHPAGMSAYNTKQNQTRQ